MKTYMDYTNALLEFIDSAPTAYHAVHEFTRMLTGYEELRETESWNLEPGGRYYVVRGDSSLIAFRLPEDGSVYGQDLDSMPVPGAPIQGFLMAAAHSDCPLFKIKPNGETVTEGYLRLNTEKYGGMLMAPWMDRPLSVAGRLITEDITSGAAHRLRSHLVDLKRPVAIIPNLAIHMNRQANENMTYNAQVDLLPLIGSESSKGLLLDQLADEAGISPKEILGSDLFLYNAEPGEVAGIDDELLMSRSLDDLQCAWALMQGLLEAPAHPTHVTMCCIFDNEEVGSGTMQGADSTFLADTCERIAHALGLNSILLKQLLRNSFLISADNAHAVHPAHPEKADPTNRPHLNEGVVLKFNANQKYTTNALSEAMIRRLCADAQVPLQTYTNRSDMAGGSTLGNICERHLSVHSADIGLAQLAMHSPYETAGARDTEYLVRLIRTYFGKEFSR